MIRMVKYRRLAALLGVVAVAYLGLVVWLYYRQVVLHPRFAALGRENLNYKNVQPARRGNLLDRRGVVLATSVPVKTVCADPALVAPYRGLLAQVLAPLLEMPAAVLEQKMAPRLILREVQGTNTYLTSRYAVLRHKVPLDRWQAITQTLAGLRFGVDEKQAGRRVTQQLKELRARGIYARDAYQRHYPNGTLAAQVLGFVASGESEKDEGTVFEDHGVAGIEAQFNERLNGMHGWSTREHRMPPSPGLDVVLTLDTGIQFIVETELARAAEQCRPTGAVAVVLAPRTGEILALASWPTFDPARPGDDAAAFRNRAIMDQLEPGSTFKGPGLALALEHGVLQLEERVHCENGYWREARLRDAHPYGELTFLQVLAKSSNIGTAKGVRRLGPERLYEGLRAFGFGAPTLVPLPGEVSGVLWPPRAWDGLSLTRIPIGQGVSVTPLQLAVAYAALANGGVRVPPRLVSHLAAADGRLVATYPVEPPRRVVRESVAAEMTRALKAVVSPEGTGKRARLEHYQVAGKTGTAQVSAGRQGYKPGRYYASFVGYLPAERPEVCILVGFLEPSLRQGYEGGALAAPVFAAIAARVANYLRLEPDLVPEPDPEGPARLTVTRTLAWQRAGLPAPPLPPRAASR